MYYLKYTHGPYIKSVPLLVQTSGGQKIKVHKEFFLPVPRTSLDLWK